MVCFWNIDDKTGRGRSIAEDQMVLWDTGGPLCCNLPMSTHHMWDWRVFWGFCLFCAPERMSSSEESSIKNAIGGWKNRTDIDLLFQNSERYHLPISPHSLLLHAGLHIHTHFRLGQHNLWVCVCVCYTTQTITESTVLRLEQVNVICQLMDVSIYISASAWQMRFPLCSTALLFLTVTYKPSEVTNTV